MQIIYGIKRFFKNLIDWFPILFNDEHWDEIYLYKVIEKKLELMQRIHEREPHTLDNDQILSEIWLVRVALCRIINGDYAELVDPKLKSNHMEMIKNIRKYEDEDKDLVFDFLRNHSENWWS